MSRFTPTVCRTTEFQGDTVTVIFRRMQNKHVKIIAPFMQGVDEGNASMRFSDLFEMISVGKEVFSECVVSISGLKDDQNNDVPLETVLTETYFMALVGWMFNTLAEISFVGEADAKKSGPASSGSSVSNASDSPSSLEG